MTVGVVMYVAHVWRIIIQDPSLTVVLVFPILRAAGAVQMLHPPLLSTISVSHPSSLAIAGTHTKLYLNYWYVEP